MQSCWNLSILESIKRTLQKEGVFPRKSFGQSFLTDSNVLKKILCAAQVSGGDLVLEIGAGTGALTRALADCGAQVIAVEKDKKLFHILQKRFESAENITVLCEDFLKINLNPPSPPLVKGGSQGKITKGEDIGGITRDGDKEGIKVIGNIPYRITTPILEKLLAHKRLWTSCTLMVQKEVAQRMTAKPGTKTYGSLSVWLQYHTKVKVEAKVSRNCFYPVPKVDSCIVHITPVFPATVSVKNERMFFSLVRACFQARRKQLQKVLRMRFRLSLRESKRLLEEAGFSPAIRAETFSVSDFAKLSDVLAPHPSLSPVGRG